MQLVCPLEDGLNTIVKECIEKEYAIYKGNQNLEEKAYAVEMLSVFGKIAYSMYKNRLLFLLNDEY
jgi:hypothetical protein